MEKLKTIEDLNDKYDDQNNCGYTWNIGDVYTELHQIAIEWVKQLNMCISENCNHQEDCHHLFGDIKAGDGMSINECIAVKGFIEHFFGITKKEIIGIDYAKGKDKTFIKGVRQ